MTRRILLLAAALAIALLGTTIVFGYSASRAPEAAVAAEPQTRVLVAKELIPAGTTGAQAIKQGLVAMDAVPTRLVPPGALIDVVAVQDQESAVDIQPGELLLPSRFVSTALAGSLAIPGDKVAISIEVGDPQRVAGFVRPGLDVALFDTYEVLEPTQAATEGQALPRVAHATRLLLTRATVIAVGPTALETIGAADPTAEGTETATAAGTGELRALVTLAVSIREAQKVAHAAQTGQITLGLLSKDSRTGTIAADDNRTLFQ